ncbi:hypothetical protein L7F22_038754 [Adiantum nelumboides]|nr:hypothetical protein [Adiantum nelumboides]
MCRIWDVLLALMACSIVLRIFRERLLAGWRYDQIWRRDGEADNRSSRSIHRLDNITQQADVEELEIQVVQRKMEEVEKERSRERLLAGWRYDQIWRREGEADNRSSRSIHRLDNITQQADAEELEMQVVQRKMEEVEKERSRERLLAGWRYDQIWRRDGEADNRSSRSIHCLDNITQQADAEELEMQVVQRKMEEVEKERSSSYREEETLEIYNTTGMSMLRERPMAYSWDCIRPIESLLHKFIPLSHGNRIIACKTKDLQLRKRLVQPGHIGCIPPWIEENEVILMKPNLATLCSSIELQYAVVRSVDHEYNQMTEKMKSFCELDIVRKDVSFKEKTRSKHVKSVGNDIKSVGNDAIPEIFLDVVSLRSKGQIAVVEMRQDGEVPMVAMYERKESRTAVAGDVEAEAATDDLDEVVLQWSKLCEEEVMAIADQAGKKWSVHSFDVAGQ